MARPRKKIPLAEDVDDQRPDPWAYVVVWGSDPGEVEAAAKGLEPVEMFLNMETSGPWMAQIFKLSADRARHEADVIGEDFMVEAAWAETVGKARFKARQVIDFGSRIAPEENA